MIPGWRRYPEVGDGNPLQDSWISLVAQTVKCLPAMRETQVRFLGREDPLEKEMATHRGHTYSRQVYQGISQKKRVQWLFLKFILKNRTH